MLHGFHAGLPTDMLGMWAIGKVYVIGIYNGPSLSKNGALSQRFRRCKIALMACVIHFSSCP